MINTILFATDLGAFTAHSALHVESLAEQFDAKVVVLHALPPMSDYALAMVKTHCPLPQSLTILDASDNELLLTMREQIFDSILREQTTEQGLASMITDIVVAVGAPANLILQHAQECSADLIVIGSHGVNAIDGSVLGSVASKVLQLAKTPVYMVPMVNPNQYNASVQHTWVRQ